MRQLLLQRWASMEKPICTLVVCTDACVRGPLHWDRSTGTWERYKIGPATAACVGWLRSETSTTPVVKANAHLGRLGPNKAEFRALILGLEQTREYLIERSTTVTHVLLCSDSAPVLSTLSHRKNAIELAPLREQAREVEGQIVSIGVEVNYEYLPRKNPWHLQAHQLADSARRKRPS
jgi:ribonuclease HI